MNKIKIEKAKEKDFNELYTFFETNTRKFFKRDYTQKTFDFMFDKLYSKKRIKEIVLGKGSVLIAIDGDKIVGLLMQFYKEEGGVAFANWFMVDEKYHGKGIGTQMLKSWENECLLRGVHSVYLCTEDYNVKFYEKRGFTYMGVMPHGWFGAPDHYMYKEIQEPKEENYLK